jgi:epidermal growth factor receptor substrate 15
LKEKLKSPASERLSLIEHKEFYLRSIKEFTVFVIGLQIWQYADKGQTGSLSREEFYNALKLVTVAQTGRELTPVLVAKALNGPAALQIPAPQIQYPTGPMNVVRPNVPLAQPSPIQPIVASSPLPKTPTGAATASHMPMIPPTLPPTPVLSSTFTPTPINGAIATSSTDWPTTKSSSWSGPASSATNLIGQPSSLFGKASLTLQDILPVSSSYQVEAAHSATSAKNAQLDLFGGDVFTAVPAKASSIPSSPRASEPVSMGNQTFNGKGVQTFVRPDPSSTTFPVAAPIARTKSLQSVPIHTGQQEQGFGSGTDETRTWPKLTDLIIRRYAKIFSEVDTDKDGKISGIQARDLFLSWRLPRGWFLSVF